jgi:hypothetical protein
MDFGRTWGNLHFHVNSRMDDIFENRFFWYDDGFGWLTTCQN